MLRTTELMRRYYDRMETDGELEDMRKGVEMAIRTLGLEVDTRKDDKASLPTFIINIGRGGITAQEVVTVEPQTPTIDLTPSATMRARLSVNQDIEEC